MKKQKIKTGFTLVELIVVITVLAILSTIGLVSYSGYLEGVRDTNRTSQLKSLSDSLVLYKVKKSLPIPDNKVDVYGSGVIVSYQGELGENIIEAINYTEEGVDPKDGSYFTYYLTADRKYFQLLTHLEEKDLLTNINETFAFDTYDTKFPFTEGSKLGILMGDENSLDKNTPINKLNPVPSIDLLDTTSSYTAMLSNKYKLTGTGLTLSGMIDSIKVGGRGYSVDTNGNLIYTDLDNLYNIH